MSYKTFTVVGNLITVDTTIPASYGECLVYTSKLEDVKPHKDIKHIIKRFDKTIMENR
jgi:hypothetical protein